MQWEGLNERLEEAFRAGFEEGYNSDTGDDGYVTDQYVEFLLRAYPEREKDAVRRGYRKSI
jgi:hypothetical protein